MFSGDVQNGKGEEKDIITEILSSGKWSILKNYVSLIDALAYQLRSINSPIGERSAPQAADW